MSKKHRKNVLRSKKKVRPSTLRVKPRRGRWDISQVARGALLIQLGEANGINRADDWYQFGRDKLHKIGAGPLLREYGGSPFEVISALIRNPAGWHPWLFKRVSPGFWKIRSNRGAFLRYVGEKEKFYDFHNWYQFEQSQIEKHGGAGFGAYYKWSPLAALKDLFPDYNWLEWLFKKVPNSFWKDRTQHKRYADWLAARLGYLSSEDWYRLKLSDLTQNNGSGLVQRYYDSSPTKFVMGVYPDIPFKPWLFEGGVPKGFWKSRTNQKRFLNWLGGHLGIEESQKWAVLTQQDVRINGGAGLLAEYYQNSPTKMVKKLLGISPLYPWEEGNLPKAYWKDPRNCRAALERMASRIGYCKIEDWYQVRQEDFRQVGLYGLVQLYGGSPIALLMTLWPEYAWDVQKFGRVPLGHWDSPQEARSFLRNFLSSQGLEFPWGFYKVRVLDLVHAGGMQVLKRYGRSFAEMIIRLFPEHQWDYDEFFDFKKGQGILSRMVSSLLPGEEMLVDDRKAHGLKSSLTGKALEIDIWLPRLKVAIEYQGAQHYRPITFFGGYETFRLLRIRDEEKRRLCRENGITLIEFSYQHRLTRRAVVLRLRKAGIVLQEG